MINFNSSQFPLTLTEFNVRERLDIIRLASDWTLHELECVKLTSFTILSDLARASLQLIELLLLNILELLHVATTSFQHLIYGHLAWIDLQFLRWLLI